jgi:hypothetical protein
MFTALLCAGVTSAAVDANNIPDLMAGGNGWNGAGPMTRMPGSPPPVDQDPKVKYVGNNTGRQTNGDYEQPTWRYADLNNSNLTQFAKDGLKKANDLYDAGFSLYGRTSRCWQPGVVALNFSPGRTYFIQTPKEVLLIWQRDQIVRHIYLNVPHTQNPKLSWNGESVGHYEGDTLVVDTIGLNTKSFVDAFRTPHSEQLHVIERYRVMDGGKTLQVEMTIEDPVAFVKPWKVTKRWEKVTTQSQGADVSNTYNEEIRCMDGEMVNPFNQQYASQLEPLPTASKADF